MPRTCGTLKQIHIYVFKEEITELPPKQEVKHGIDLCKAMPKPAPLYRLSPMETCGVPVHQSPKCVLDCSQGPAGRECHSLGSKWAFIHSQKEDPLRNLLVYGLGGQGNNIDLPILGVLQQYLEILLIGLGLLHLSLRLLLLRLGLLLLKLGLWHLKLELWRRA
ncbi:hypothetical protein DSO57_1031075 [Entomophthora muscae]|uniref:Uncharacterized protein n=1 Tax=Entomophthora muscae TaxID=34485 RepID=A0ACC2UA77_9FUNG|nr:hypothetical protein DSO57_1031075 [Entomophthora muscae]